MPGFALSSALGAIKRMHKTIFYLFSLALFGYTKQSNMPCNDSIFLEYRTTSFQSFDMLERKYYQDKRDACGDTIVCADKNVKELLNKRVSEMSDEEYAIFQDILKDCRNINPCSLEQFKQIKQIDDKALSINEKDLKEYCINACAEMGHNKLKPGVIVIIIVVGALALIGGSILAYPLFIQY